MSSSNRYIDVIPKPAVVVATPLHDGNTGGPYPKFLEGFVVQATQAVHFGTDAVTGETNGFTVRRGEACNITGFLSRGSPFSYDLTKIFYIGGPWKLVIERQT